jgi:hypothetical protein
VRCFICDSILQKPSFNRQHKAYDPCHHCLDIIADVFNDHPEEDEMVEVEATPEELLALTEEQYHE